MNTRAPEGNDMETQAQIGSSVKMRKKPKARPPRTNVLTINEHWGQWPDQRSIALKRLDSTGVFKGRAPFFRA
jgi:hypothetical protein